MIIVISSDGDMLNIECNFFSFSKLFFMCIILYIFSLKSVFCSVKKIAKVVIINLRHLPTLNMLCLKDAVSCKML